MTIRSTARALFLGLAATLSLAIPGGNDAKADVTLGLQLYALDLESVAPVDIMGTYYNLHVLGGTRLGYNESLGSIGITENQAKTGGSFTSTLPVTAELIFTPVGGGTSITGTFSATFSGTNVWSATPGPDDAHNSAYPAGGFYAGVVPGMYMNAPPTTEQSQLAAHGVIPAQTTTPAPPPPPVSPGPGFDLFATVSTLTYTVIDINAETFYVSLKGDPSDLDARLGGNLGNTDTIVERLPEPSTWIPCVVVGLAAPVFARWRRRRP